MPGERGVMFIGCDQQTPGADVGAVDHHIFGWDSDLGQLRGDLPAPGSVAMERAAVLGTCRLCLGVLAEEPSKEGVELMLPGDVFACSGAGRAASRTFPALCAGSGFPVLDEFCGA